MPSFLETTLELTFKYLFASSPALKTKGGMKLKKEGRIAKVYRLHQEGVSIKEIAKKMKPSQRIVGAYIWRAKNLDKSD